MFLSLGRADAPRSVYLPLWVAFRRRDVGLLGAVGIVLEPNCIPSTSSGQARTWSSSFWGRCVITNLREPESVQATELWYNAECSAKNPSRGYYAEEFLNMQALGAFVARKLIAKWRMTWALLK